MSKFNREKTYALFQNPANRRIIAELEVIGATVILFPAPETRHISNAETTNLAETLNAFDWLIFPDVYAVEFFLQTLEKINFDFFELDNVRVCAYGESVADRLRYAQLHADIIPNSIKTAEVLQAIRDYFLDESELKEARFLILNEKTRKIGVTDELRNLGAHVAETAIYEIIGEEESQTAKLKSLLKGGAVDEFIFTSPFDVINLAHLFPTENLADVLTETALYATDKTTTQAIEEFRLVHSS